MNIIIEANDRSGRRTSGGDGRARAHTSEWEAIFPYAKLSIRNGRSGVAFVGTNRSERHGVAGDGRPHSTND